MTERLSAKRRAQIEGRLAAGGLSAVQLRAERPGATAKGGEGMSAMRRVYSQDDFTGRPVSLVTQARIEAGLRYDDLCQRAHVHHSQLSRFEYQPREVQARVAAALGVTVESLVEAAS